MLRYFPITDTKFVSRRIASRKWTQSASRIWMRTCAERGDWGIVGSEARAVRDDQVGLACQVRLGLLERERVGECGIARHPDHFHGMMADKYIATILLHALSFADNESLGQSASSSRRSRASRTSVFRTVTAILQFVRHFVVGAVQRSSATSFSLAAEEFAEWPAFRHWMAFRRQRSQVDDQATLVSP